MVKQHSIAKNTQRDSHFQRKKREKEGGERIETGVKESSQANKQTHKWQWVLKTRLAKLQNQKREAYEEELDSTVKIWIK